MFDSVLDAFLDSVKMLPFLFATYLIMEALEHKAGKKTNKIIERAGKIGPLWGGILGIFPQCGFSAAASNLYVGKVLSLGTLISIYLSTSDEMLPIFISESVNILTILKILGIKVIIGMISGFVIEFVHVILLRKKQGAGVHYDEGHINHCNCDHKHNHGILISSIKHTFKIFIFIFIISSILNLIIFYLGEEALSELFVSAPIVGQMAAGIVGLIPNCAASVVITELYLEGIINAGAMMSGLLVSAGAGTLVLFRRNKNIKENLGIIGLLYMLGVIWGCIIEFSGITF